MIPAGGAARLARYAYMACRDCQVETATDPKHAAVVDKFAERHGNTEGHSTVSGVRPVRGTADG